MVPFDTLYDCRYYSGYKPCGRSPLCSHGCAAYEPRGKRILIIKLGAMGDVLRTTPLLHSLRRLYDPCCITWITAPESELLLRHNPLVDRLLLWGHDTSLIAQAEIFDLLLNFEKEQRAIALDALVQADEKKGFALHPAGTLGIHNAASEYALRLGIDDELKFRLNQKSAPRILAEMAELPYDREEYILEIGPDAEQFARDFAKRHALRRDERQKVIGLNTGCGAVFPTKQWPMRHFATLARLLHDKSDAKVLLLGGPREREMNRVLMRECPEGSLIDTGCDNSLEEFFGIVEACDLLVTSDSMAMHVAIARRKKVVALLGSTSVSEIDLYDRGEILTAGWDCAPCYRRNCDKAHTCMDALEPERVLESMMRLVHTR